MKTIILLLFAFSSILAFGQIQSFDFKLEETGGNKSIYKVKENTHFLKLNKPKGKIIISYINSNPLADSINNITLIDVDEIQIFDEKKNSGNEYEWTIGYDLSNYIDRLTFLVGIVDEDTTYQKRFHIYISLSLNYEFDDINLISIPKGQLKNLTLIGSNIEFLTLNNIGKNYDIDGTNLTYKYFQQLDKIELEIKSNDTITISHYDLELKVFISNKFVNDDDTIIDFITVRIDELQITPSQRGTIKFLEERDLFLTCPKQQMKVTISDQQILTSFSFNIYNEYNNDTIAKVLLRNYIPGTNNSDGYFTCEITPISVTEANTSIPMMAKIRGRDYNVLDLRIFNKPIIDKYYFQRSGQDINVSKLYYGMKYTLYVEGSGLNHVGFGFPLSFTKKEEISNPENSQRERVYEITLPEKLQPATQHIIIKGFNSCFDTIRDIEFPTELYYTTIPKQPKFEDFITIELVNMDNDIKKWDQRSNWINEEISNIIIKFNGKALGKIYTDNYYGEQKLNVKVLVGEDSTLRSTTVYPIDQSGNKPSSDVNDLGDFFDLIKVNKPANRWTPIIIKIYNDKMDYSFEIKRRVNQALFLRPLALSVNPITYDFKNQAIYTPLLVSPFTSFGLNFYKKNPDYAKQLAALSSLDLALVVSGNAGAFTVEEGAPNIEDWSKLDYGIIIVVKFNPLNSEEIINESGFDSDAFNLTLGFAYLIENKSPILTFGLGLAFDKVSEFKKNK